MLQIFQVSTIFMEATYHTLPNCLGILLFPPSFPSLPPSFPPSQGCVSIENLNLSHMKATDRGIHLLLHSPLTSLSTLNLSHTRITSSSLSALPRGLFYPSPFPSVLLFFPLSLLPSLPLSLLLSLLSLPPSLPPSLPLTSPH